MRQEQRESWQSPLFVDFISFYRTLHMHTRDDKAKLVCYYRLMNRFQIRKEVLIWVDISVQTVSVARRM